MIYIFVCASVHYALFEDEEYLLAQTRLLEDMLPLIGEKYNAK